MQKSQVTLFVILAGFLPCFLSPVCSWAETKKVQKIVIAFLGDSLTAGYGVLPDQAYPALIQKQLQEDKEIIQGDTRFLAEVINSGVSGDTTSDGLNRLEWVLMAKPSLLFIALGANDMMRGITPERAKTHLKKIILTCQKRGIRTAVLGMKAFPNLGKKFSRDFEKIFSELSSETGAPLYPFLLENVAGEKSLNLSDGIHPNQEGQKKISQTVYPFIRKELLQTIEKQKKTTANRQNQLPSSSQNKAP